MKTDRELLELAAKAAAYNVRANHYGVLLRDRNEQGLEYCPWNPLTDDGDALRLAEKLGLTVCMDGAGTVSASDECNKDCFETQSISECGGSRIKATRRAIVRAAAAIGESM